jgi:hypothetical protein
MKTQIFHHHAKNTPNLQNPKTLARSHQNQVIKQPLNLKVKNKSIITLEFIRDLEQHDIEVYLTRCLHNSTSNRISTWALCVESRFCALLD